MGEMLLRESKKNGSLFISMYYCAYENLRRYIWT